MFTSRGLDRAIDFKLIFPPVKSEAKKRAAVVEHNLIAARDFFSFSDAFYTHVCVAGRGKQRKRF